MVFCGNGRQVSFLILLLCCLDCWGRIEEVPSSRHPALRGATHRRRETVCLNGNVVNGNCVCEPDFLGKFCEKQKHCATFRRFRNGSCPICETGYSGEYCEDIVCGHGHVDNMGMDCICDNPWTGKFCEELNTRKVYGYYNRKVYLLGPLGALSIIPMCLTYIGCERMAKKRQTKRVGLMFAGQNISVRNKTLHQLLVTDV